MAKMFYSLEEAAQRLDKSADEVREMAQRGEITEFRDGENLIFKVDQIDLLAGDDGGDADDDGGMIPLVDTSEGSALGLADSSLDSSAGRSGISIFDADETEEADPMAQTQMTDEPIDSVSLESFGSGSGLMDLTRESDDTSLGADGLLDELYAGEETASESGVGGGSALFEGAPSSGSLGDDFAGAGVGSGGSVIVAAEAMDPKGSGLAAGLTFGAVIALGAGVAVLLMGMLGAAPELFRGLFGGNALILTGIMLGVTVLFGGIGFFLGSRN